MHMRVIIAQYGLIVSSFGTAETRQNTKITNREQTKQDVLVINIGRHFAFASGGIESARFPPAPLISDSKYLRITSGAN